MNRRGSGYQMVVRLAAAGILTALLAGCASSRVVDSEAGSTAWTGAGAPAMEGAVEESDAAGVTDGSSAAVAFAERKLIFTGDMTLRVEEVARAMAAARRWVGEHDGFVEAESTSNPEDGYGEGSMTLRVPREQYEPLRAYARTLALEVLDDGSQRQDVTGQYADLDARLKNLKAAETELQALLTEVREGGGKAEDILAVYRELTTLRGEIESLQSQIDALGEQVALSTLRLRLVPPPVTAADVRGEWQPRVVFRGALADLTGALQWLADAAIYLLVTSPFWLILLALLWAAWRGIRWLRRRGRPTMAPPPAGGPTAAD